MQKYSETWRHLKSILSGYNSTYVPPPDTYQDHVRAKTLAVFFANATLGTPQLDRNSVEAILSGTLHWPHKLGRGPFKGSSISLSLLEDFGMVTFYAGWCTVQCQTVRNAENLDPSLLPLFEALEHLRDISYGREGYIQPHFVCADAQLEQLIDVRLFSDTPDADRDEDTSLGLRRENGNYVVDSRSKFFDSLVSTYLWQELRVSFEPELAFARWIACVCANSSWERGHLLFDHLEYEERSKFAEQLLVFLAKDSTLSQSLAALWMQHVAAVSFAHNISTTGQIDIEIDAKTGKVSQSGSSTIPKITLENLADVFPVYKEGQSELMIARDWYHNHQNFREPGLFYTSIIGGVIDAYIRIDGESLVSYSEIEELFTLAETRPILKHILLHALPSHRRPTFLIWLLSRSSTCDIALFYLSIHSPIYRGREEKSYARNMDRAYQELVCKEYLSTLFDGGNSEIPSLKAERLLNILSLLVARCGLDANEFSNSFEYQFLMCLLGQLQDKYIFQLTHSFVQGNGISVELWRDRSQGKGWYLLAFWLLESLERTGAESLSTALTKKIQDAYTAEFRENFSGQKTLQPNAFFASLPWHRLLDNDGVSTLLLLSKDSDQWPTAFNYSNNNNFSVCSAVRHYLLVLMCIGRPQRAPKDWNRVANRVSEIVRAVGFDKSSNSIYLFNKPLFGDAYDLWSQFCSYTNLFPDQIFDDLLDRLCPYVPLDHLFYYLNTALSSADLNRFRRKLFRGHPMPMRLDCRDLSKHLSLHVTRVIR